MSLFADSLSYTFEFWKDNLSKILLYQLLFFGLDILAGFIIGIGAFFLFFVPLPFSLIPFVLIAGPGFVLLLVFGYVQFAGYSLMIKRKKEKKEIEIVEIFKECFKISHKILVVGIIQSLPMIIFLSLILLIAFIAVIPFLEKLPSIPDFSSVSVSMTGLSILPFIKPTSMEVLPDSLSVVLPYLILLVIIVSILLIYVELRIWLSIPVFMLEKKGCIESVKGSWKITKGKVWSIFFVITVLGLLVGIFQSMVKLPFIVLSLLYAEEAITYIGDAITYLIFTPLSLILPTAYYYSIKAEEKKKEI